MSLSIMVNMPLPCAHALNSDNMNVANMDGNIMVEMAHPNSHNPANDMLITTEHKMPANHEMPMGDMGDDADHEHSQHNDCKINCEGGLGCDSCVNATASLNHPIMAGSYSIVPTKIYFYIDPYTAITSAIEPPPPRA